MPVYEYECLKCGEKFDVLATLDEKDAGLAPTCPKCGARKTEQVFGTFTLLGSRKGSDEFDDDLGADDLGGGDDDDFGGDDFGAGDDDLDLD